MIVNGIVGGVVERCLHYLKDEARIGEAVNMILNECLYHVIIVCGSKRPRDTNGPYSI